MHSPSTDPLRRFRLAYHRRRSPNWFVSFPKSGRTWTKSLVERYVSRLYGLPAFTFETFTPWRRNGPWRQVPRLVFVHPACRDASGRETERFIERLARRRVVLLVRDPREVVYTYYFRLRRRMNDPLATRLGLAEFIRHPEVGIDRVVDFTNAWYAAGPRFRDFLFLRLEDVQADPAAEIGRLLNFLDIETDHDLLLEVIESTPDATTREVEDPRVSLTAEDRAFLDAAMARIDPALRYQARG